MSERENRRRLTAILAADAVGYSRHMSRDDQGTVAALDAARLVFRAAIEDQSGHLVDMAGDSVLATFDTASGAVTAALAVQDSLVAQYGTVPEEERLLFRIGVNLGEIIEKPDGTVYGDGVNIAARLESLADPGGIAISGSAHEQVASRDLATFEFIGEKEVKNIDRPIRTYRAMLATSAPLAPTSPEPEKSVDRPSIVVLPFDNRSGDAEQEYFSDGIAEDLITELSKISGLFVIARNSAFTYKGRAIQVPEIAAELGVRHVLSGSVRKAGERVRISAELVDGATGGQVWADRFDRELTDIFAVQDEVTEAIVGELSVTLTAEEGNRLSEGATHDLVAYDHYLRAREQAWNHKSESNKIARQLLTEALEIEPGFASALALLGFTYIIDHSNNWGDNPAHALVQARDCALRALEIHEADSMAHFVLSLESMQRKTFDEGIRHAQRAIEIDPNFADGHGALGGNQHYGGRSADAIPNMQIGVRLNPHFAGIYQHFIGQCYFQLRDYARAIEVFEERIAINPGTDTSRVWLASACGMTGDLVRAKREWDAALGHNPAYALDYRANSLPYSDPAHLDHFFEGLRRAGIADALAIPSPGNGDSP
jgi:adenylate cyclase